MITPVIIQILFWIGVIVCLILGLGMVYYGAAYYQAGMGSYLWKGILLFILGPLAVRVYCEILIVFFRINETLTEIENILLRREPGK